MKEKLIHLLQDIVASSNEEDASPELLMIDWAEEADEILPELRKEIADGE
jgi:hypothetical protein